MSLSFFTSLLHSLLLSFQFLFPLLENVTFATGRPTCDSNYGVPDLDDCHYIIRNQLQRDDLRFRAFAPNIDDMSIANVGRVMPGYFISNNGDNGGVGAGSAGGTGAGAFPIIRGPLGRISTAQIAGMTVSQRAQFYSSLAVAAALQGIPRNDVVRPAGSVGSVGTSGGAVGTTPSAAAVNMMAARMRAAGEYSPVNVQRLFRIEHGQ
ncbi:MAG: hypothetical protein M1827_006888 [Pycnora praestabilis]|nr:MAG: hypothetical protein M1827_006888 [Pycnora praestabilis]